MLMESCGALGSILGQINSFYAVIASLQKAATGIVPNNIIAPKLTSEEITRMINCGNDLKACLSDDLLGGCQQFTLSAMNPSIEGDVSLLTFGEAAIPSLISFLTGGRRLLAAANNDGYGKVEFNEKEGADLIEYQASSGESSLYSSSATIIEMMIVIVIGIGMI